MDLRHLGDPLFRPQALSLFSFLLPCIHPCRRPTIRRQQTVIPLSKPSKLAHRTFRSSSIQKAPSPSSIAADLDSLDDLSKPNLSQTSPSPRSSQRKKSPNDTMIDNLLAPTLDQSNQNRRKASKETSASIVDDGYQKAASEYYSQRDRGNPTRGSIARSMAFPKPTTTETSTPSSTNTDLTDHHSQAQTRREIAIGKPTRAHRTIRSSPSVGRTIEINPDRGMDIGRALRSLEIQCAVNRVRSDLMRQRFHERPGMKRKRLKSERWRRLFKESFLATVQRVKEMRRKGW